LEMRHLLYIRYQARGEGGFNKRGEEGSGNCFIDPVHQ